MIVFDSTFVTIMMRDIFGKDDIYVVILAEQQQTLTEQLQHFVITAVTADGFVLSERGDALYKRYRFVDFYDVETQQSLLSKGWVGTAIVMYNDEPAIQFRQQVK